MVPLYYNLEWFQVYNFVVYCILILLESYPDDNSKIDRNILVIRSTYVMKHTVYMCICWVCYMSVNTAVHYLLQVIVHVTINICCFVMHLTRISAPVDRLYGHHHKGMHL